MSDDPWHVCQSGLTPIVDAVGKIAEPHPSEIVKWLREGDLYSPLSQLQSVLNKRWMDSETRAMTSTRREMVRRWMQSNGYEADANECESRLSKLTEELDSWQSQADYIANGRVEWKTKERKSEFVELVDIFGDDTRDWFNRLTEQAEDTWNYLRQLNSSIRQKLPPLQGTVANVDSNAEGSKIAAKEHALPSDPHHHHQVESLEGVSCGVSGVRLPPYSLPSSQEPPTEDHVIAARCVEFLRAMRDVQAWVNGGAKLEREPDQALRAFFEWGKVLRKADYPAALDQSVILFAFELCDLTRGLSPTSSEFVEAWQQNGSLHDDAYKEVLRYTSSRNEVEATNQTGNAASDVAYSSDFRSVRWFGERFTFTTTQAACVEVLWRNWEQGTPVIGEVTVLDDAGSAGDRLRDVFDKGKHPAWGTLIKPVGKGAFQLAEPDES